MRCLYVLELVLLAVDVLVSCVLNSGLLADVKLNYFLLDMRLLSHTVVLSLSAHYPLVVGLPAPLSLTLLLSVDTALVG